eukprot:s1042_g9.t2
MDYPRSRKDTGLGQHLFTPFPTASDRPMTSGAAGGYVAACASGCEAVEIQVLCLNGEGCNFTLSASTPGHEVRQNILQRLPSKKGRRCMIHHENAPLLLQQTLQEQVIVGKTLTLSCTFVPFDLYKSFYCILGFPVSEQDSALEGVTSIKGAMSGKYLKHLPKSLETIAFGDHFNQTLEGVSLPNSLQSLTFGSSFDQTLARVNLPKSLQSLTFGSNFNQTLERVSLPNSLHSLTFGDKFNQTLEGVSLPNSLQSLTFGYKFSQTLEGVSFPSSLQSLTFGYSFNQTLEGVSLPNSLQSLTFGREFNQTLEGVSLPNSLQSLTFGNKFNQTLESVSLPNSLQSLTFGREFNQTLERVSLPNSLQSLTFGDFFNQTLEGVRFPNSLQHLTFGYSFKQTLEGVNLPSSLQSLTFGYAFNQTLERVSLPSSLQSLTFGSSFDQTLARVDLPKSLQSLTFGHLSNRTLERVSLPSSLQSLTFGHLSNRTLKRVSLPNRLQSLTFGSSFNHTLEGVSLPSSLQSLIFGSSFNQTLEGVSLPNSLQSLTFGGEFNQTLEGVSLPSSLQSLTFGSSFDQTLERVSLPNSLQSLTFGNKFNQTLERVSLPNSLQSLTFGGFFNQTLEGVRFPNSLQHLTFGYSFNQTLEGVSLPNSLQSLTFGDKFNQTLEGVSLPNSLQSLTLGRQFNQILEGVSLPNSLERAMLTSESKVEEAMRISMLPWITFLGTSWLFLYCYEHVPSLVLILLSLWTLMCLCTLLAMQLRPKVAQGKHGLVVVLSLVGVSLGVMFGYWNYSRAGGVGDYWAAGSHQHYTNVNPMELADAHRDAGVLVFQQHSRPDARLSTAYVAWGQLISQKTETCHLQQLGPFFWATLDSAMRRLCQSKLRRAKGFFARWRHAESHWPDGTPKRFRGKDAWKNWINWDAPFREESDELNRQRKFFWEVDDKGALWRIELQETGRFGQMKHPKVVDDFFSHLQRNRTGEFPSFPFVSLKTHEHYYVRWAKQTARLAREVPIVFNDFRDGHLVHLVDGGLAKSLSSRLDPSALRLTPEGRLLHPVSTLRKEQCSP